MSKSKKEIEKSLKQVEQKYLATLEAVRLKWLRSVYREALEGGYGFKSLGEVVWTSSEVPRLPPNPENLTALEIEAEVERYQAEITHFKNAIRITEKNTARTLREENLTGLKAESLKRELRENVEFIQKGIDVLEKRKGMFGRRLLIAKLKHPLFHQKLREAQEIVEKARRLNDEISMQIDKLKNMLTEMDGLKTKHNELNNEFLKTNLDPNKQFPPFNIEVQRIIQQTLNQLSM